MQSTDSRSTQPFERKIHRTALNSALCWGTLTWRDGVAYCRPLAGCLATQLLAALIGRAKERLYHPHRRLHVMSCAPRPLAVAPTARSCFWLRQRMDGKNAYKSELGRDLDWAGSEVLGNGCLPPRPKGKSGSQSSGRGLCGRLHRHHWACQCPVHLLGVLDPNPPSMDGVLSFAI